MIKTLFKVLLLVAVVGYLVFALIKVSRTPGEIVCTGVEYSFSDTVGQRLVDEASLEKLLGQHKISPKGKSLEEVDVRQIEQSLMKSPYVDTVTCYHTAAGKLCIQVTPRCPIMHVFAADGDEFYVSNKGTIMPAGGLSVDLPVITGNVTRQFASTRLIPLAKILCTDKYWSREAQQVYIDTQGNVEIIPRVNEQKILLGEARNFGQKLQRVRLFYEKAMPKVGWNKYSLIDASYENQVICTRRK